MIQINLECIKEYCNTEIKFFKQKIRLNYQNNIKVFCNFYVEITPISVKTFFKEIAAETVKISLFAKFEPPELQLE
jgi:hypothetical protein